MIEVLVYIALVAGVLLAATSFAWNIVNSRTIAFTTQEVEQNGRFILQKMSQIIREANQINSPAISVVDSSLEVETDELGAEVIYLDLSGTDVTYQYNTDPAIILNSDLVQISNLQFANLSTNSGSSRNIGISFDISHINPNNRPEWTYTKHFQTAIELRDQ